MKEIVNNKTNKPDHMIRQQVYLEKEIKEIQNSLPNFLGDYFVFLKSSVSPSTHRAYLLDISFFFEYLLKEHFQKAGPLTLEDIDSLKARDVNLFLGDYCPRYYKEQGDNIQIFENNNRSLSRKKSSLVSMFRFLFRNEQLHQDITPGLNPIKIPKKSPDSIKRLTSNEMLALIHVVSTGEGLSKREKSYWEKTKYRDKAILLMFLTYGLRLKELVDLNLDSMNYKRREFTIFRKRDKESQMPFNDSIEAALKDYINLERPNYSKTENALFISIQGTRLTQRAVRTLVKKYTAIVMGTSKKNAYSPHKLRATAATTLIERGFSIYDVQNLLDHDNVTTTQLYAAHKKNVKKEIIQNFELDDENL